MPKNFNLDKFSQILYHSHEVVKAKNYLEISNALYNKNVTFDDLSKRDNMQSSHITISYLKSIEK